MGGSSAVLGAAPASKGTLEVLKKGNQHGIFYNTVCVCIILACNVFKIVEVCRVCCILYMCLFDAYVYACILRMHIVL